MPCLSVRTLRKRSKNTKNRSLLVRISSIDSGTVNGPGEFLIKKTYEMTVRHGLTTSLKMTMTRGVGSDRRFIVHFRPDYGIFLQYARNVLGTEAHMLSITPEVLIPESELKEDYVRASGPGGQHVNKSNTAVQLRFDIRHSPSLSEYVRELLCLVLSNRINANGEIVIDARRFRSREQNRRDAENRLVELLRHALKRRRRRIATLPTEASRQRRISGKHRQSESKKRRSSVAIEDE